METYSSFNELAKAETRKELSSNTMFNAESQGVHSHVRTWNMPHLPLVSDGKTGEIDFQFERYDVKGVLGDDGAPFEQAAKKAIYGRLMPCNKPFYGKIPHVILDSLVIKATFVFLLLVMKIGKMKK